MSVQNNPLVSSPHSPIVRSGTDTFLRIRELLRKIGVVDERGFPIPELHEVALPPLQDSEVERLHAMLDTPIRGYDKTGVTHVNTSVRAILGDLMLHFPEAPISVQGSYPFTTLGTPYLLRALGYAINHLIQKQAIATPSREILVELRGEIEGMTLRPANDTDHKIRLPVTDSPSDNLRAVVQVAQRIIEFLVQHPHTQWSPDHRTWEKACGSLRTKRFVPVPCPPNLLQTRLMETFFPDKFAQSRDPDDPTLMSLYRFGDHDFVSVSTLSRQASPFTSGDWTLAEAPFIRRQHEAEVRPMGSVAGGWATLLDSIQGYSRLSEGEATVEPSDLRRALVDRTHGWSPPTNTQEKALVTAFLGNPKIGNHANDVVKYVANELRLASTHLNTLKDEFTYLLINALLILKPHYDEEVLLGAILNRKEDWEKHPLGWLFQQLIDRKLNLDQLHQFLVLVSGLSILSPYHQLHFESENYLFEWPRSLYTSIPPYHGMIDCAPLVPLLPFLSPPYGEPKHLPTGNPPSALLEQWLVMSEQLAQREATRFQGIQLYLGVASIQPDTHAPSEVLLALPYLKADPLLQKVFVHIPWYESVQRKGLSPDMKGLYTLIRAKDERYHRDIQSRFNSARQPQKMHILSVAQKENPHLALLLARSMMPKSKNRRYYEHGVNAALQLQDSEGILAAIQFIEKAVKASIGLNLKPETLLRRAAAVLHGDPFFSFVQSLEKVLNERLSTAQLCEAAATVMQQPHHLSAACLPLLLRVIEGAESSTSISILHAAESTIQRWIQESDALLDLLMELTRLPHCPMRRRLLSEGVERLFRANKEPGAEILHDLLTLVEADPPYLNVETRRRVLTHYVELASVTKISFEVTLSLRFLQQLLRHQEVTTSFSSYNGISSRFPLSESGEVLSFEHASRLPPGIFGLTVRLALSTPLPRDFIAHLLNPEALLTEKVLSEMVDFFCSNPPVEECDQLRQRYQWIPKSLPNGRAPLRSALVAAQPCDELLHLSQIHHMKRSAAVAAYKRALSSNPATAAALYLDILTFHPDIPHKDQWIGFLKLVEGSEDRVEPKVLLEIYNILKIRLPKEPLNGKSKALFLKFLKTCRDKCSPADFINACGGVNLLPFTELESLVDYMVPELCSLSLPPALDILFKLLDTRLITACHPQLLILIPSLLLDREKPSEERVWRVAKAQRGTLPGDVEASLKRARLKGVEEVKDLFLTLEETATHFIEQAERATGDGNYTEALEFLRKAAKYCKVTPDSPLAVRGMNLLFSIAGCAPAQLEPLLQSPLLRNLVVEEQDYFDLTGRVMVGTRGTEVTGVYITKLSTLLPPNSEEQIHALVDILLSTESGPLLKIAAAHFAEISALLTPHQFLQFLLKLLNNKQTPPLLEDQLKSILSWMLEFYNEEEELVENLWDHLKSGSLYSSKEKRDFLWNTLILQVRKKNSSIVASKLSTLLKDNQVLSLEEAERALKSFEEVQETDSRRRVGSVLLGKLAELENAPEWLGRFFCLLNPATDFVLASKVIQQPSFSKYCIDPSVIGRWLDEWGQGLDKSEQQGPKDLEAWLALWIEENRPLDLRKCHLALGCSSATIREVGDRTLRDQVLKTPDSFRAADLLPHIDALSAETRRAISTKIPHLKEEKNLLKELQLLLKLLQSGNYTTTFPRVAISRLRSNDSLFNMEVFQTLAFTALNHFLEQDPDSIPLEIFHFLDYLLKDEESCRKLEGRTKPQEQLNILYRKLLSRSYFGMGAYLFPHVSHQLKKLASAHKLPLLDFETLQLLIVIFDRFVDPGDTTERLGIFVQILELMRNRKKTQILTQEARSAYIDFLKSLSEFEILKRLASLPRAMEYAKTAGGNVLADQLVEAWIQSCDAFTSAVRGKTASSYRECESLFKHASEPLKASAEFFLRIIQFHQNPIGEKARQLTVDFITRFKEGKPLHFGCCRAAIGFIMNFAFPSNSRLAVIEVIRLFWRKGYPHHQETPERLIDMMETLFSADIGVEFFHHRENFEVFEQVGEVLIEHFNEKEVLTEEEIELARKLSEMIVTYRAQKTPWNVLLIRLLSSITCHRSFGPHLETPLYHLEISSLQAAPSSREAHSTEDHEAFYRLIERLVHSRQPSALAHTLFLLTQFPSYLRSSHPSTALSFLGRVKSWMNEKFCETQTQKSLHPQFVEQAVDILSELGDYVESDKATFLQMAISTLEGLITSDMSTHRGNSSITHSKLFEIYHGLLEELRDEIGLCSEFFERVAAYTALLSNPECLDFFFAERTVNPKLCQLLEKHFSLTLVPCSEEMLESQKASFEEQLRLFHLRLPNDEIETFLRSTIQLMSETTFVTTSPVIRAIKATLKIK